MRTIPLITILVFLGLAAQAGQIVPEVVGNLSHGEAMTVTTDAEHLIREKPWALVVQKYPSPYADDTSRSLEAVFAPLLLSGRVRRIPILEYQQDKPGEPWRRYSKVIAFCYQVSPKGRPFGQGTFPDLKNSDAFGVNGKFTTDELTAIVDLIRSKPRIPKQHDDRIQTYSNHIRSFLPILMIWKDKGGAISVWTSGITDAGEVFDVQLTHGQYTITDAGNYEE